MKIFIDKCGFQFHEPGSFTVQEAEIGELWKNGSIFYPPIIMTGTGDKSYTGSFRKGRQVIVEVTVSMPIGTFEAATTGRISFYVDQPLIYGIESNYENFILFNNKKQAAIGDGGCRMGSTHIFGFVSPDDGVHTLSVKLLVTDAWHSEPASIFVVIYS